MINDSRLKGGTLTLGTDPTTLDMSCQITNVRITSAYSDDGNAVTTLCGDSLPAPRKLDGHKLEGTFIQDFDVPVDDVAGTSGVVAWVWAHDLQTVAYEYVPDATGAPTITGNLLIEIPGDTYGGDVNARLTSDFAWTLQGKPTFTAGGGSPLAESASSAA